MADRMRRPLLILLAIVVVAAVSSIVAFTMHEHILSLNAEITRYQKLVMQLKDIAAQSPSGSSSTDGSRSVAFSLSTLQDKIAEERDRYYLPGSMTTSQFASSIEEELLADGLTVVRYRPIQHRTGNNSHDVEFVVRGPGDAVLTFLRHNVSNGKYRYIRDISVHSAASDAVTAGSRIVDATLRVGYEQIDKTTTH